MPSVRDVALLKDRLWVPGATRPASIYGVLDCARRPEIYAAVTRSYREKCCLFAGVLDPELERAAPHLLLLNARDSVTDYVLMHGWTDAWGILLESNVSFNQLRRHLRTFLRVRDEAGRFLLFRYYDPRVLGAYLPTCTASELQIIFGSAVTRIVAPSAEFGTWLSYTFDQAELQVESMDMHLIARS